MPDQRSADFVLIGLLAVGTATFVLMACGYEPRKSLRGCVRACARAYVCVRLRFSVSPHGSPPAPARRAAAQVRLHPGPPLGSATIAQVHRATLLMPGPDGTVKEVEGVIKAASAGVAAGYVMSAALPRPSVATILQNLLECCSPRAPGRLLHLSE